MMENYRVNINDLFDQDEPFLFNNIEFRRLIKRMHDKYVHLVNPNFDLSQIVQDTKLTVPANKKVEEEKRMAPKSLTE